MRKPVRSIGLVLWLVVAAAAFAEPPRFLGENAVDPAALLPAPPSDQSPETKAELELLLRVQERRTPEEVARVKTDAKLTIAAFAGVLGPWLTPENLPRMDQLFQKVEAEARQIGARGRTHFGRKRPQLLDERIKPVLEGHSDPCYPSGNSTRGILMAILLAELAPAQREALLERGREIGWNRVIGGVHYPSDLTAGRVLGVALARALLANPKFQEEFSKVREEFEVVRKKQP